MRRQRRDASLDPIGIEFAIAVEHLHGRTLLPSFHGAWTLGGTLLNVGSRFDDVKNTVALDSYTTLDVYANYAISKDWQLQTKVNNLANKSYETAAGYNQAGRAVFVTLRYAMK